MSRWLCPAGLSKSREQEEREQCQKSRGGGVRGNRIWIRIGLKTITTPINRENGVSHAIMWLHLGFKRALSRLILGSTRSLSQRLDSAVGNDAILLMPWVARFDMRLAFPDPLIPPWLARGKRELLSLLGLAEFGLMLRVYHFLKLKEIGLDFREPCARNSVI